MQIHAGPASRRGPLACGSRSRRPGPDAACNLRPAAGGRQSTVAPRMPARQRPQPHAGRPQCQPGPGELCTRARKIVFADELRPSAPLHPEKRPRDLGHRPNRVPDYELKYPPVTSRRDRSRYAAVFQDQYGEFSELQREVGATQAKLQQLEALLLSLPPPRSQKEVRMAAHVRREFEKKQSDPGFLDKQARCNYLKGKLRHLKAQIRKFDDQRDSDSEDSVYF
ncbi:occludin/ELL domain-containing protein 1 isoform X1 [Grammomys surdaster]|uniref:occludin/ELL domain-containing protein 1 isoform X1 n=1 Tax=Grammomys surdaster TaxID=491861 RepID=UPI00109F144D|nr:occludin/ELL domain-containing protein 1 isoform X1 [Grammomys surdaster]